MEEEINIIEYDDFFVALGKGLGLTSMAQISATHECLCAACNIKFEQSALNAFLNHQSRKKMMPNSEVISFSSSKGSGSLAEGKCPECGHSRMKIKVG